jgi:hypothetical protein
MKLEHRFAVVSLGRFDREAIAGRAPSASHAGGRRRPRLLRMPCLQQPATRLWNEDRHVEH